MKVQIYFEDGCGEYALFKPWQTNFVEVSREFFAEYKKIDALHKKMQRKLEKIYQKALDAK